MKKIKNMALYLALILIILSMVACGPKDQLDSGKTTDKVLIENNGSSDQLEYPMEIEDKFGNKEIIEEEPRKIVSLAPSNTEMLFALGLGDKVVGVTSYCDYPEEAATKEIIGGYREFNLEKIVELGPDLILSYGLGDEEENKILRDAGIKIIGFMSETIDEVVEDMKLLGKMTGSYKKSEEITQAMVDKKNEIVGKVKDKERVKVFYEIWHDPLRAAGEGSFMGELLVLAGGDNIAVDKEGIEIDSYPIFDLEQLVERDPEIYLTSGSMPEKTIESIKERPGFEDITAIKNDMIYIFQGDEGNIVSRPGPRIVEALELVAKSIHPELFE